jgi:phytanoyl-CoA hydroxylase
MHDLDPVLGPFARSPKVRATLQALGLPQPMPMQSMYITKSPSIGGVVVPHQDSCFLHTTPDSCVGIWLALQDARRDNGCLWAVPGSHTAGVAGRFVLTPDRKTRWADGTPPKYPDFTDAASGYIPLEARAGTLVVLHGAVMHASAANTSLVSRHAYSVHYVDASAKWERSNWLQRAPDFPPVPL